VTSEVRAYLKGLRKRGYAVAYGGNGHWQVRWGREMVTSVTGTKTNGRAMANTRADVKRFERGRVR
jgi:hypothetical protein